MKNKHPIRYDKVLKLMEKRYQEKIPKHGDSWKDCGSEFLIKRILEEIEVFNEKYTRDQQLPAAIDIANFASMLVAVSLGHGHAFPKGHIPGWAFRSMGGP